MNEGWSFTAMRGQGDTRMRLRMGSLELQRGDILILVVSRSRAGSGPSDTFRTSPESAEGQCQWMMDSYCIRRVLDVRQASGYFEAHRGREIHGG